MDISAVWFRDTPYLYNYSYKSFKVAEKERWRKLNEYALQIFIIRYTQFQS